eukprot:CAMPEP_0204562260 /NCGR_PEP_ID=MMETSP0661-20131031/33654_1 /ASSEMBLY_ACC=CAM_ASM_000606 /TAXON_ID=109239 /ORGANISM="Alexandrium margalefi, Strain AMGDE01CS-322" /LENGTH=336 /DNA_ID=CAMNT_0051569735 /DNA_START=26 /DNA_END=1036 /DNA_ORIENTATION=-
MSDGNGMFDDDASSCSTCSSLEYGDVQECRGRRPQRCDVLRGMFGDEYPDPELEDVVCKTLFAHDDDWLALASVMLVKNEDDRVASFRETFGSSITSEEKIRSVVRGTLAMAPAAWLDKSKEALELELDRLCSCGLDFDAAKLQKASVLVVRALRPEDAARGNPSADDPCSRRASSRRRLQPLSQLVWMDPGASDRRADVRRGGAHVLRAAPRGSILVGPLRPCRPAHACRVPVDRGVAQGVRKTRALDSVGAQPPGDRPETGDRAPPPFGIDTQAPVRLQGAPGIDTQALVRLQGATGARSAQPCLACFALFGLPCFGCFLPRPPALADMWAHRL